MDVKRHTAFTSVHHCIGCRVCGRYVDQTIVFRTGRQSKRNGSKRKLESDDLEQCYEKSISQFTEEDDKNKVRMLLPVKTQNGFIESRTIVEDNLEEDLKGTDNESNEMENEEIDESKSLDVIEIGYLFQMIQNLT